MRWKNPLTVQRFPVLSETTTNCIAWGTAKQKATIQTTKMNLTARDNLDIVCCLFEKIKNEKTVLFLTKKQRQRGNFLKNYLKGEKKWKKQNMEYVIVPLCTDHLFFSLLLLLDSSIEIETTSILLFIFLAGVDFLSFLVLLLLFVWFRLIGMSTFQIFMSHLLIGLWNNFIWMNKFIEIHTGMDDKWRCIVR